MRINPNNKGFTLIELLVVISIIGVLSSIVLASLTQARLKGQVAKVQEELEQVRNGANLYYISNGSYGPQVLGTESAGTSIGPGCASNMFASTYLQPILASSLYPSGTTGICTASSDGKSYAVSIVPANYSGGALCNDATNTIVTMSGIQASGVNACVPATQSQQSQGNGQDQS